MTTNLLALLPDTIQLIRRDSREVEAGAPPYALYVCGDFWCTCDSLREAEEEIIELLGRAAP